MNRPPRPPGALSLPSRAEPTTANGYPILATPLLLWLGWDRRPRLHAVKSLLPNLWSLSLELPEGATEVSPGWSAPQNGARADRSLVRGVEQRAPILGKAPKNSLSPVGATESY